MKLGKKGFSVVAFYRLQNIVCFLAWYLSLISGYIYNLLKWFQLTLLFVKFLLGKSKVRIIKKVSLNKINHVCNNIKRSLEIRCNWNWMFLKVVLLIMLTNDKRFSLKTLSLLFHLMVLGGQCLWLCRLSPN
jgi:hypothetical protein